MNFVDCGWRAMLLSSVISGLAVAPAMAVPTLPTNLPALTSFTPGDLVVSTVSLQPSASSAPNSGLDTASPITLSELQLAASGISRQALCS